MTPEAAIAALAAHADPARAAQSARYHKVARRYLGVVTPVINDLAQGWRRELDLAARFSLADGLWQTDIFEARIAAAKILTQARIRPDDGAVWDMICGWVPDFDSWAIADTVAIAGMKRLVADPARVAALGAWVSSPHMWARRAALVMTLHWARLNHPKPGDIAIREQVLDWAAAMADDRDWFIQKAIAWWLRDLSKHDAARTRAFLDTHGGRLKPFARKEAARYLA